MDKGALIVRMNYEYLKAEALAKIRAFLCPACSRMFVGHITEAGRDVLCTQCFANDRFWRQRMRQRYLRV